MIIWPQTVDWLVAWVPDCTMDCDKPWPRHCVSFPSFTKSSMSYTANLPPVCSAAGGNSRSPWGLKRPWFTAPVYVNSHQTRRFTIAKMKKRFSKHILATTCGKLLSSGSVHGGRLNKKGFDIRLSNSTLGLIKHIKGFKRYQPGPHVRPTWCVLCCLRSGMCHMIEYQHIHQFQMCPNNGHSGIYYTSSLPRNIDK